MDAKEKYKSRKPYIVRKTVGWHYDKEKDKQVQEMITIGYTATKAEGLQMLAEYNNNPFDTTAASYFKPLMEQLNINRTPHCCRHTCISMLAEAGINQTIIKKIVEHSGAMTLTEKVYTHFDIKELVDAINQI